MANERIKGLPQDGRGNIVCLLHGKSPAMPACQGCTLKLAKEHALMRSELEKAAAAMYDFADGGKLQEAKIQRLEAVLGQIFDADWCPMEMRNSIREALAR